MALACWLCVGLLPATAQVKEADAPAPRFELLDVADGLTANEVSAIMQDRQGFLWVGTWIGLHRYDGHSFRAFLRDPADSLSLANSWIRGLHEDRAGNLWVATDGGASRFDPVTEAFTNYQHDPANPASISSNRLSSVVEDATGTIWVGTRGGGLNRFDPATETFTQFRHDPEDDGSLNSDNVLSLLAEPNGTLWVGTGRGLNRLDVATGAIARFERGPTSSPSLAPSAAYTLHRDRGGRLWIGSIRDGLYRFDSATETFVHYPPDTNNPDALGHPWVLSITEDQEGALWVGTDGGGLHRYDPATDRFTRYTHDPTDAQSLSDDRILSAMVDRTGVLWVGTYRGLGRRYPLSQYLAHERARPSEAGSLSSSDISSFLEDGMGALWVGTDGGGLNRRDPETGVFTFYRHDPSDPGSLGNDAVLDLAEDDDGAVWVGTYDGLYRRDPQTGRFARFTPQTENGTTQITVAYELVYADGHLWVGTYNGLFDIETATGRVVHYAPEPDGFYQYAISVYPEPSGRVWVGTFSGGFGRLDPPVAGQGKRTFTRIREDAPDPESLQWGMVLSIYRGQDGALWVGGGKGLNRLEVDEAGNVTQYHRPGGLSNVPIDGITEDAQGRLWVTTVLGLSWFDPQAETLLNYDAEDGFPGGGTLYRSPRTGQVYVGGGRGYYSFDPANIAKTPSPSPVVLTGLRLLDERVQVGVEGAPLNRPLAITETLRLRYDDRVVSFEFAALDFREPNAHRYAVRLDGFDEDWREVGAQREVTFTNLSPGRYRFRVRAAGRDGIWGEAEASVAVVIAPPLWRTGWAYLAYALLILGLGAGIYRDRQRRATLRHRAEIERIEAEQLRALDRAKSRFFANVSHEFRTPLTLTLGPLDDLRAGLHGSLSTPMKEQVDLAHRNAARVLDLVNQILDIARLEAGRTPLRARRLEFSLFAGAMAQPFEPLAERRALVFKVETPPEPVEVWADPEQLEKVFTNLLSNAIKFTPEGGTVRVSVEAEGDAARLTVRDSGPGIPATDLPYVFDRFHQVNETSARMQPGTGIGLALAREIADLHKGTLAVESEEGFGSTFMLTLPLGRDHLAPEQIVDEAEPWQPTNVPAPLLYEPGGDGLAETDPDDADEDRTTVLVVEDHAEVRAYIRRHLEPGYRVLEAADGEAGLTAAREQLPDLVVSDVMMPGLSGFELCRALKTDPETSFLPVILLTAKAEHEDRLEGLGEHADDYLTKPFDPAELRVRIENLIALRRRLRERYRQEGIALVFGEDEATVLPEIAPTTVDVTSTDAVFLTEVRTAIETHLGDETLTVERLAEVVGVSRGHLHRQLKALADQTPSEAIRTMRLERAAQLLKAEAGTVSEIAYAVGFKGVAHFSNSFDRQFGCRPSVYAAEQE